MIGVMPIYDFKCGGCGHRFEALVKLDQTPKCPACSGNEIERLFSFPAISTESSRKRSFAKARARANEVHKEKKHAEAEYTRNYIKDHSEQG